MGLRRAIAIAIVLVVASIAAPAGAAPGGLDPNFGDHGKVLIDGSEGVGATARNVVVQRTGRIIAVGTDAHAPYRQSDTALYGLTQTGQVDFGFGFSGQASFDEGNWDRPSSAVRQSSGAVVVLGTDYQGTIWLARFTPDGRLDAAFGEGGVERLPYRGPGFDERMGVAVTPDDRILVAFKTQTEDLILGVRLPDGGADTTFSEDGFVSLPHDQYTGYDTPVAALRDGRIVVGIRSPGGFTLYRVTPAGELDRSFSRDGMKLGDFGIPATGIAEPTGFVDLAVRPRGAIVVVGYAYYEDEFATYPALGRFTSTGKVDRTFGKRGHVEFRRAGQGEFEAVVLQHGGAVVAVGSRHDRSFEGSSFLVARYGPDGRRDRSFSRDGWATADPATFNRAFGVALEPTGNIVVTGIAFDSGQPDQAAVVRFFGG